MTNPIAFFGTPAFAAESLKALIDSPDFDVRCVVTQPDRARGRGQKVQFSPVKELAAEHEIPVLQPGSIRKELPEFLNSLRQFEPLACNVVAAFGQILPTEVLELPEHGSVNVHASILPRWRGAAPIQRCLLAGDTETGICLMKMTAGLDEGPVFSCHRIPITPNDNTGTLHDTLAQLGGAALQKDLPKILSKELRPLEQAHEHATYARKISPDEGNIDWTHSAEEILHRVQAFAPRPGAYSSFDGKRWKILRAASEEADLPPGRIELAPSGELIVGTDSASLRLLEIQQQGKKSLAGRDFANGVGRSAIGGFFDSMKMP